MYYIVLHGTDRVVFTFGKGGQMLQAFWHPLLDHYEHGGFSRGRRWPQRFNRSNGALRGGAQKWTRSFILLVQKLGARVKLTCTDIMKTDLCMT